MNQQNTLHALRLLAFGCAGTEAATAPPLQSDSGKATGSPCGTCRCRPTSDETGPTDLSSSRTEPWPRIERGGDPPIVRQAGPSMAGTSRPTGRRRPVRGEGIRARYRYENLGMLTTVWFDYLYGTVPARPSTARAHLVRERGMVGTGAWDRFPVHRHRLETAFEASARLGLLARAKISGAVAALRAIDADWALATGSSSQGTRRGPFGNPVGIGGGQGGSIVPDHEMETYRRTRNRGLRDDGGGDTTTTTTAATTTTTTTKALIWRNEGRSCHASDCDSAGVVASTPERLCSVRLDELSCCTYAHPRSRSPVPEQERRHLTPSREIRDDTDVRCGVVERDIIYGTAVGVKQ